jgi:hypothetical protein
MRRSIDRNGLTFGPYVGLRVFAEADAERFFGRDGDVTRLLHRLVTSRFLAVLGPSASGKSSLVLAGLLPALRAGALPGADTWNIGVLRPGPGPSSPLAGDTRWLQRRGRRCVSSARRADRSSAAATAGDECPSPPAAP